MSTTITLPKRTPIVVLCGVASPYLHSIKLTFVDNGHIIKVRKWYGNDRFGKLIGFQDLYFDGEEERADVLARVKVALTKDKGETWQEYDYEEVGDYTDLHLIKRIVCRERGDTRSDASVSFNYYRSL
jgi:hypothetical protein